MNWEQIERDAMIGDRQAILEVVSALRQYRALVKDLAAQRYTDGTVDGASMSTFLGEVAALEAQDEDGR